MHLSPATCLGGFQPGAVRRRPVSQQPQPVVGGGPWLRGEHQHLEGPVGGQIQPEVVQVEVALEGWMESLQYGVRPYGIHTTIVEPGFFRTELLVEGESSIWPELSIDDYAERTTQTIASWKSMNGRQGGDPAKLGAALVTIATLETPPLRFVARADVVAGVEQKAQLLLGQVGAHRELSSDLQLDDA